MCLRPDVTSEQGRASRHWFFHRRQVRKQPGSLTLARLLQAMPQLMPTSHTSPPCRALPPHRVKGLVPGWAGELTNREWNQLRPNPQGFRSSNLGPKPAPDWVMMVTGKTGRPSSHLAPAQASPTQAHLLPSR